MGGYCTERLKQNIVSHMRLFNNNEKRIIKQLVDDTASSQVYLPINAFNDIFFSRDVGFDTNGKMELVFPYNASGVPSHEELIPIYNEVLERVLLIDYLEKEGVVYIVPASTSVNSLTHVGNIVRLGRISMEIDPQIGNILLKCMNRPLYVSETLRQYVDCGFKSLEELALDESKKQTKYSFLALLLSILAIVISLFQTCNGGVELEGDSNDSINRTTNILLNYMQNNLEPKLEGTMNNTAEIKLKLADTIVVRCISKDKVRKYNKQVKPDECVKYLKVNVCQDTIVSKAVISNSLN